MNSISVSIAAALALLAGISVGAIAGTIHGKTIGKEEARTEAALQAVSRITDMETHNANFKNLPPRERCRIFMRDSGLPADSCDQR